MTNLYKGTRAAYKPFTYPWLFDYFDMLEKMHWIPSEVSLQNDMTHWRARLTPAERHLLEEVQKYLANADTDVSGAYVDKYLPYLRLPEARSVLLAIANMEAIHQQSYALTIDTLGMSEDSYGAFLEIPEMYEKHLFLTQQRMEEGLTDVQKFLIDIAVCSGFGEGLQLFSAFAIILSFNLRGMMPGLSTLTTFIARDEDAHCEIMLRIMNTIKQEHPEAWTSEVISIIEDYAYRAVVMEDHFIDLSFQLGEPENLAKEDIKLYIRYICNKRMQQMGLSSAFAHVTTNPLPWIDELLSAPEHANFFETRSTSYSKANFSGSWDDVWAN